jgi:transposase
MRPRGQGQLPGRSVRPAAGSPGPKKAALAVAHSILVIAWYLLSRGEPYSDLGADYFVKRQTHQAYRDRLVRQLERMGHKVTLEPTAA